MGAEEWLSGEDEVWSLFPLDPPFLQWGLDLFLLPRRVTPTSFQRNIVKNSERTSKARSRKIVSVQERKTSRGRKGKEKESVGKESKRDDASERLCETKMRV